MLVCVSPHYCCSLYKASIPDSAKRWTCMIPAVNGQSCKTGSASMGDIALQVCVAQHLCGTSKTAKQHQTNTQAQPSCGRGCVEQGGARRCNKGETPTRAVLASRLLLDPRLSSISNSMSSLHTGQADVDCWHTKIYCCRYDLYIVNHTCESCGHRADARVQTCCNSKKHQHIMAVPGWAASETWLATLIAAAARLCQQ